MLLTHFLPLCGALFFFIFQILHQSETIIILSNLCTQVPSFIQMTLLFILKLQSILRLWFLHEAPLRKTAAQHLHTVTMCFCFIHSFPSILFLSFFIPCTFSFWVRLFPTFPCNNGPISFSTVIVSREQPYRCHSV